MNIDSVNSLNYKQQKTKFGAGMPDLTPKQQIELKEQAEKFIADELKRMMVSKLKKLGINAIIKALEKIERLQRKCREIVGRF